MASIRDGDVEALQVLLERYWHGLHRYATRLVGRSEDATDLVQETFIRVWEHRARWISGGSVRAYLYRIVRNFAHQQHRHMGVRSRSEFEIRQNLPRVATPAEEFAKRELHEAFEAAVRRLPQQRREAFELVRLRGLSLQEAAEVMGVTRRTVANHLYLAAKDLEEELRPFLS